MKINPVKTVESKKLTIKDLVHGDIFAFKDDLLAGNEDLRYLFIITNRKERCLINLLSGSIYHPSSEDFKDNTIFISQGEYIETALLSIR